MSSNESRKRLGVKYTGTIVPNVALLINRCNGTGKEFRIVYETELKEDEEKDNSRLTIVVRENGDWVRDFWG